MLTMYSRAWMAIVVGLAITTTLVLWSWLSRPWPDKRKVATAEDEIYETVVRDMFAPARGQVHVRQIIFDNAVLNYLDPGVDTKSCQTTARRMLMLESGKPAYDSIPDKVYRLFTRSAYGGPLRADTIQNALERSCIAGPVSQTFRTDLPRTFIPAQNVHFTGYPVEEDGPASFEKLFPGSGGIISLSHVGFDRSLHEAIVSTRFVCGFLCGSGYRYILRKKSGRWQIANKLLIWVS